MKKLLEPHLLKGYAFGIAYDNGVLQLAFIKLGIEVNFSVVKNNLSKFRECLREN